jgi:hypothetical protein
METTMSQTTRKEILERLRRRYRTAGPKHKRKLIDRAQELLGYHRKSAIRELGAPEVEPVPWINAERPVSRLHHAGHFQTFGDTLGFRRVFWH